MSDDVIVELVEPIPGLGDEPGSLFQMNPGEAAIVASTGKLVILDDKDAAAVREAGGAPHAFAR